LATPDNNEILLE